MHQTLALVVGQRSDKGRKELNQDCHGVRLPREPQLSAKGVAAVLADGISSSDVSHIASRSAVGAFLEDYYCTSDAWSVKTSAERVLNATNAWLYAHTQQGQGRYDKDRGYVCTLSAMVIKSATAHLFHIGDARIYRWRGGVLEQLTRDHRLKASGERSYLTRALGINPQLEIDYLKLPVDEGDVFLLATDGVYEYLDEDFIREALGATRADAADRLVEEAARRGSPDDLTALVLAVERLPQRQAGEIQQQLEALEPAPLLQPSMRFDGYTVVRELHGSSRSHLYLARDEASGGLVALKIPSIDLRDDPAYLERFILEEWVARRVDSPHVVKPFLPPRPRGYLYVATEFVDGQSLAQWMVDHPRPSLETVRGLVEQIGAGLRAFHRLEMLHRDLRPENIMIDANGTVKILDFGAARVAGIDEADLLDAALPVPGALQYAAPEYFLGESGSTASDVFSLGVIAYRMLCGGLPFGTRVAKCKNRQAVDKLRYASLLDTLPELPVWVDGAIRKAVHTDPRRRYRDVSEFLFDLRHPDPEFLKRASPPLLERNPVAFWKGLSLLLAVVALLLAQALATR